jgi:monofunctional glycosyltransferase
VRRLLAIAGVLALFAVACALYFFVGLPSRDAVRVLAKTNPGPTALMRQRADEAKKLKRKPVSLQVYVPIAQISKHLIHAVLASEDQKFFGHQGVDWEAMQEAAEKDRAAGRFVSGGSTITQQLAKNLFFGTRKSLTRKLRELLVSRWLEQDLGKRRILELYLNVIEWGDGLYGCQVAAQTYYGIPASGLGPEQAAGLAAMIPNPRRINPRTAPALHARAQKRVLWLMAHAGFLGNSGLGREPPPPPEPEPADADEAPPQTMPPATLAPETMPSAPSPEASP